MDALSSASAQRAAHSDTVERLARTGYFVKGVLYALVGGSALLVAFGRGGEATGTRGVIRGLADAPFGSVLLWGVALGLVAYALWRFVQSILDPEDKGSDTEGIVKRVGLVGSGLIYAGLAVSTFRILLGGGSGGGSGGDSGGAAQEWSARLLEQPFGPWLLGLAGLITVAIGGYQVYRAWSFNFADRLKTRADWAITTSRFGIAARGVVFVLMGLFVIGAAVTSDAQEARGLDGTLSALRDQPFGPYLLGAAAVGLVAYGVYCFVNARYRRFE